ncbi:MAG: hypothetical protein HRT72_05160 [Flavobacteriales bacterium]|nr:hypothetical protein [Flavobacteriales bacterium]
MNLNWYYSDENGLVGVGTFQFNDAENDVKGLKSGSIKGLDLNFEENVEYMMANAVYKSIGENKWMYAWFESGPNDNNIITRGSGNMDFVIRYHGVAEMNSETFMFEIKDVKLASSKLHLAGGVAYNNYDAGNYTWAYSMKNLGFSWISVKSSSEINGLFNGKRQNGADYPWYKSYNYISIGGDDDIDQKAIKAGYDR